MNQAKQLTRRQCRQLVVCMLYEYQLSGNNPENILQYRVLDEGYSEVTRKFVEKLFRGIIDSQEKVDEIITKHLIDWDFERVAPIEKNILRMATFEYLPPHATPPEVVINEAVEISKSMGSAHSSQFINAVLDKIASSLNLL